MIFPVTEKNNPRGFQCPLVTEFLANEDCEGTSYDLAKANTLHCSPHTPTPGHGQGQGLGEWPGPHPVPCPRSGRWPSLSRMRENDEEAETGVSVSLSGAALDTRSGLRQHHGQCGQPQLWGSLCHPTAVPELTPRGAREARAPLKTRRDPPHQTPEHPDACPAEGPRGQEGTLRGLQLLQIHLCHLPVPSAGSDVGLASAQPLLTPRH